MSSRIHAPSKSAKLRLQIADILTETERWINTATICTELRTWAHDPNVTYALKMMTEAGAVVRKSEPGIRGKTYFYRRVA